jgi:hypothetical protein
MRRPIRKSLVAPMLELSIRKLFENVDAFNAWLAQK